MKYVECCIRQARQVYKVGRENLLFACEIKKMFQIFPTIRKSERTCELNKLVK